MRFPKFNQIKKFLSDEYPAIFQALPIQTQAFITGFLMARGEEGIEILKGLDSLARLGDLTPKKAREYLEKSGVINPSPKAPRVSEEEKRALLMGAGWYTNMESGSKWNHETQKHEVKTTERWRHKGGKGYWGSYSLGLAWRRFLDSPEGQDYVEAKSRVLDRSKSVDHAAGGKDGVPSAVQVPE